MTKSTLTISVRPKRVFQRLVFDNGKAEIFKFQEHNTGSYVCAIQTPKFGHGDVAGNATQFVPKEDECMCADVGRTDGRMVVIVRLNHFVPYFFLHYERGDGHWHDFISHNGTRIITANQDHTNPKTITLSPPITARRIRIIPYRRDSPQFMCLKLSVLGYNFDESLMSYEIPEGDVYHSGSFWASLNDSSYDGVRHYSKRDAAKRNHLSGGLGVLVDRQIYAGGEIGKALVEPFSLRTSPYEKHQTVSGLVGWFCRSGLPLSVVLPPCQSLNVTLLFTFNSIRQFTELRIHALNSFEENIAVFREALVQFSIGGQFFDHYAPSIRHVHPLNVSSTQPTWVVIPLHGRVGRFIRISLTFQSDWIILSEVVFNSSESMKTSQLHKTNLYTNHGVVELTVSILYPCYPEFDPHLFNAEMLCFKLWLSLNHFAAG
ncbi:hypothetical protein ACTXT7_009050 [Hymenolepis weldensis]